MDLEYLKSELKNICFNCQEQLSILCDKYLESLDINIGDLYIGGSYKGIFKIIDIQKEEYSDYGNYLLLPRIRICGVKYSKNGKTGKSVYTHSINDIVKYESPDPIEKISKIKPTYVYLIEAGDLFKIGFSNNPSSRLKGIQTHNPYKCSILYKIKDPFGTLEKDLHLKFKSLRINGEWFKNSALIISEFETLKNNEYQSKDKSFTLFPISD